MGAPRFHHHHAFTTTTLSPPIFEYTTKLAIPTTKHA
jgi:hypothetical protein